jgi:hypothetical protein
MTNAKALLGGKAVSPAIAVPTLLITQTPSNDPFLQYLR